MSDIELLNEDDGFEINPEAVAEGDYIMRCLREGKDPFDTKALNESTMEKTNELLESIHEDANSPVPMVGMDQPIIVTKMFKNAFNQDDAKIYVCKDHMFSSIFEADGIGNIIECTLDKSTLTPDDIKTGNTEIIEITQEQYEEFVYAKVNDISFNEAIKTILIDEESLITESVDYRGDIDKEIVTIYTHFIKWIYQPSKRSTSWVDSIMIHRNTAIGFINKDFNKYKKYLLKKDMNDLQTLYLRALKEADKETGGNYDTTPPDFIPGYFTNYNLLFYDRYKLYNYLKSFGIRNTLFITEKQFDDIIFNKKFVDLNKEIK